MAKIFNYTFLIIGVLLFLGMAGLRTASGQLFQWMFGNGLNPLSSPGFLVVAAIFTIGTVSAIIIGTLTRQSTESFLVAGAAAALFSWAISDMFSIIMLADSYPDWVSSVIKLIMWPLIAGYFIAIVQWWRGNDI